MVDAGVYHSRTPVFARCCLLLRIRRTDVQLLATCGCVYLEVICSTGILITRGVNEMKIQIELDCQKFNHSELDN